MSPINMKSAYKASDLAAVLGKIGDAVTRQLRRSLSKFPFEWRMDNTGNKAKYFITLTLPDEIQAAISKYEDEQQRKRDMDELTSINSSKAVKSISPPKKPAYLNSHAAVAGAEAARKIMESEDQEIKDRCERRTRYLGMFNQLSEPAKQAAVAKLHMLSSCKSYLETRGYKGRLKSGKETWHTKGVEEFCQAFIDSKIDIPTNIASHFTRKGKRSLTTATIWNWRELYNDLGLYGLADHYNSSKGSTTLSILQQEFCISMFIHSPDSSTRMIFKCLETRFKGVNVPSRHAVARFLNTWLKNHESLYLYLTDPDSWRSKYKFAFGDADEKIVRLNQRWEGDSTKADIMCTDGRFSIVGNIDVWSRRPKLLVSPTSTSISIGMLLRRCIVEWGVPDEFRTDNGSDYTSYYIERVLDHLDIRHHLCDPFTPEQKPFIERFFKTFSHGILPLLDGYIGHNVAERKAIESRKTFAKRLMTRGETVEVKISSDELQVICDQWVDSMYCQDKHSKLDMSPAAKVMSWEGQIKRICDERALDLLLLPVPSNDGYRTITKKGVEATYGNAKLWYKAAEFAGYEGKRVRVMIDTTDLGTSIIFKEDNTFFCIAEDPKWYGISNQELATHSKLRQKKQLAESKQKYKEMAKRADVKNIAKEILQDREAKKSNISEALNAATVYTTPALEQAGLAVDELIRRSENPALGGIKEMPAEVLESEARRSQKVVNISDYCARPRFFTGQVEIYHYLCELQTKGQIDDKELQWIKDYEFMLDNLNKMNCKEGLMLEDPYLLKHWKTLKQAAGE